MIKIFTSTFLLFLFLLLSLSIFLSPALAAENQDTKTDLVPILQVNFGGLQADLKTVNCQGGQQCQIEWIGQYIKAIYQYGVGLAAILAVVMIMVGGFIWLASGGSPDKVGKAKEFISSALLGLFLALFSFVILYTINPQLVALPAITPKGVANVVVRDPYSSGNDSLNAATIQQATAPHYVPLVTPSPAQGDARQQDATNPPNLSDLRVSSIMPNGRITGRFGDDRPGGRPHMGIDIAGGGVATLPAGGRAVGSGTEPVGGSYLIVDSNVSINGQVETVRFVYRHISSPQSYESQVYLPAGTRMTLAEIGTTDAGSSTTGRHLHVEVWRNGQQVNPCDYISCQ